MPNANPIESLLILHFYFNNKNNLFELSFLGTKKDVITRGIEIDSLLLTKNKKVEVANKSRACQLPQYYWMLVELRWRAVYGNPT